MPSAADVAAFFLAKDAAANGDEEGGISNMKLQKLAYYAQGFHAAIFGEALFPERIEAWVHGPVVPDLYHRYKVNGRNPIPAPPGAPDGAFTQEQTDLLEEVYEVFGQFSAFRLRNMTHAEPPWKNHEADASVIPVDEMREYFKTRIQ